MDIPADPRQFEPHLMAKDLRKALVPLFPGISGESAFARILPLLPHTLLPGAKRKTYLLSQVVQALEAMSSRFPAPGETSLHRSRSQQSNRRPGRPRKIA